MSSPRVLPESYRFGTFELCVSQRRLLDAGQDVRLGTRAIDLLLVLVERAAMVVPREQLLDLVWSGAMVEENNIAVQVTAIRKLLGRNAIVTEPGRGYRFVLSVEVGSKPPEPQDPVPAVAPEMSLLDRVPIALPAWRLPSANPHLVGRDSDVDELSQELRQHRLVSVVGPAGIGKTALALTVAHKQRMLMRNGVAWIELSAVETPDQVLPSIGEAFGLQLSSGEEGLATLQAHLKDMHVLFVLDNVEHLAASVGALVNQLLMATEQVRFMMTGQTALKVFGERILPLNALSVPSASSTAEEALRHGAVALFVDQAQALDRRFALTDRNIGRIISICQELDGIALAIKLAALRLPMFGVNELSARLSNRFKLLRGDELGAPPRQQTLRAAMDWSHSLLSPIEQVVFRRFGVFAKGFTMELACAVAQDDEINAVAIEEALQKMVDCSLVQPSNEGDVLRYRLLATTRDYALLKLADAGEEQPLRRQHAAVLRALLAHPSRTEAHVLWLARCKAEIDNLRTALDWCLWYDGNAAVALLAEAVEVFGELQLFEEAREIYRACESMLNDGLPVQLLARHSLAHAQLLFDNHPAGARDLMLQAVALYRTAGDMKQLSLALGQAIPMLSFMSTSASRALLDEQAKIEPPSTGSQLRRLRYMGEAIVQMQEGEKARARKSVHIALASPRAGSLPEWVLSGAADPGGELHDFDIAMKASGALGAGVPRLHRLHVLAHLVAALLENDCLMEARAVLSELMRTSRHMGWEGINQWADLFACLAAKEFRHADAARLLGYAERVAGAPDRRLPALVAIRQQVTGMIWAGLEASTVSDLIDQGTHMAQDIACRLAMQPPGGHGRSQIHPLMPTEV